MAVTETYGPFDGVTWTQSQWYRNAPAWSPSGVIDTPASGTTTGSFGLTFNGITANVAAGRAWVRGSGYELAGGSKALTIAANTNSSLSRIDRIVLRRDLSAKTVTMIVLQGTPAGTPTAPALTQVETGQWDSPLFSFLVPPNSGTVITGVTDERPWIDPDGGSVHRQRGWTFQRASSNTSDDFSAGSMASLISGTATAAPAGDYLLDVVLSMSAHAATSGNLRLLANSVNMSEDIRADVSTDVRLLKFTTTYTHTGGDLALSAQFQTAAAIGTVFTNGSRINFAYLGAH